MKIPGATAVITKGHEQHGSEPEDSHHDDELGALGAVVRMHEEKHNESGFAGGDDQGDDLIEDLLRLVQVDRLSVDGRVVVRRETAFHGLSDQPNQEAGTDDHV